MQGRTKELSDQGSTTARGRRRATANLTAYNTILECIHQGTYY
eukprot:SAG25_NODE_10313_length_338_cov_1.493724_1_plen_42_part_01